MIETKLTGQSKDILEQNIAELKRIFPEVVTEDKIDFEKLQQVLGNYIEEENERYNFSWNGKAKALRLAQSTSMGTLLPNVEESKNFDTTQNVYIEGDNLEVLKLLQKSYHNKVKMIYIDPPYNTGNDFVYPDDYKDNLQNYLKLTGQVDSDGNKIGTNSEANGRYHTNWLNMMYPRLRLARNLLRDDGVIFISIDDNEVDNLKKICNEIFGDGNFVANIVWQSRTSISNDHMVSMNHNNSYIYAKNIQMLNFGGEPLNSEEYSNSDNDVRGPWKLVPIDANHVGGNTYYPIINPYTKVEYYPPNGRIWAYNEEKFKKLLSEGIIKFGVNNNTSPKKKLYLKERLAKGDKKTPSSLLIDAGTTKDGTNEIMSLFENKKIFDYPKPSTFIYRLLNYANVTDNDIILDFFSGSSTTAHAVMQLNAEDGGNRRFIMVQLQEPCDEKSEAFKSGYKNICEIGKERIRRAGEKIKKELTQKQTSQISIDTEKYINPDTLDVGFKVFKLDTSNIKKWNPDYDNLEESLFDIIDNFTPNRKELDIVYEIIIKYGLDLTYPVQKIILDNNKKIYSVAFGRLVICLDDKLEIDIANNIVAYKNQNNVPEIRVVFKDNSFKTDTIKSNVKEILKCNGINEFITI